MLLNVYHFTNIFPWGGGGGRETIIESIFVRTRLKEIP